MVSLVTRVAIATREGLRGMGLGFEPFDEVAIVLPFGLRRGSGGRIDQYEPVEVFGMGEREFEAHEPPDRHPDQDA